MWLTHYTQWRKKKEILWNRQFLKIAWYTYLVIPPSTMCVCKKQSSSVSAHWPVRGMMMMKQPLLASCRMRFRCWHSAVVSGTRYGDMDDWALGCWRLPSSCDTSNCTQHTRIQTHNHYRRLQIHEKIQWNIHFPKSKWPWIYVKHSVSKQ